MKEREVENIAAGGRMRTIPIMLFLLAVSSVGEGERYSKSIHLSDRSGLNFVPNSLELARAETVRVVTLSSKIEEPIVSPPVTDDDRSRRALISASSAPTDVLRPSVGDRSAHRPIERRNSAPAIVGQIEFAQLDHGDPGGKPLPVVPTLTHFGLLGGEFFFWTVEGPAGASYRLDVSTDLENWTGEEGMTTGGPRPPSGFVSVAEVGRRFFVRVTSL